MKMSSDFCDIQKLTELFRTCEKVSDSDDDLVDTDEAQPGPSGYKAENKSSKKISGPYAKVEPEKTIKTDEDIEEYFSESGDPKPHTDWKKCPEWDISYRQQVTATDVFLQMGPKNPSSACCENMILTVNLPGEDRHNMDLKVLTDRLQLDTPNYYLDIQLPHPVDPKLGNANWDSSKGQLIITLQMEREFDFINF